VAAVKHHPLRHPAAALVAITQPLFEKSWRKLKRV
jgi:hypothetical protein